MIFTGFHYGIKIYNSIDQAIHEYSQVMVIIWIDSTVTVFENGFNT